MLIIENPLKLLIIALLVMICLLLFFKFMDLLDAKKKKAASKKDKKDDSAKETKEEKQPIAKDEEPVYDPKTSTNYLYDRFVMCPTTDDAMVCENKICDSFLSEDKYKQIRNKKVDIKVNPVESYDSMSNKANIINCFFIVFLQIIPTNQVLVLQPDPM